MHGGMQHVWQKCITLWKIMQSQCTRVPFLKENQTPIKGLYVVWRLFKNNSALSQVDPSPFQRIIMWNHGILGCCILLKGSYFNGLNPSHIYCKGFLVSGLLPRLHRLWRRLIRKKIVVGEPILCIWLEMQNIGPKRAFCRFFQRWWRSPLLKNAEIGWNK